MEKDYSLLRPFDLEAAKRGEPICYIDNGSKRIYLAGPDTDGKIAIIDHLWFIQTSKHYADNYRMAPLCWVEGKPVYKGDGPLYHHELDRAGYYEFIVEDFSDGKLCLKSVPAGYMVASPENLTWTPPKVKREAWVNVYKNSNEVYRHDTKEKADTAARMVIGIIDPNRIACVRIEWEE